MWWQEPITKLKGIGPKKAADFANLNIFTIGDLLNRYPRTYVDQSKVKTIAELTADGEKQLFLRGGIPCGGQNIGKAHALYAGNAQRRYRLC